MSVLERSIVFWDKRLLGTSDTVLIKMSDAPAVIVSAGETENETLQAAGMDVHSVFCVTKWRIKVELE